MASRNQNVVWDFAVLLLCITAIVMLLDAGGAL